MLYGSFILLAGPNTGLSNLVGINVFDTRLPLKKASRMIYMIFEDSKMSLKNFFMIRNHMGVINYTRIP